MKKHRYFCLAVGKNKKWPMIFIIIKSGQRRGDITWDQNMMELSIMEKMI